MSAPHPDPSAWAAAHQHAALACLRALAPGDTPALPALHALLARPLPASIQEVGLKYDFYRAVAPGQHAWGLTVNDRHEPAAAFRSALEHFVAALGAHYDLEAAERLGRALSAAPSVTRTFGVGYDEPGRPPRLKLYFQEEPWSSGVCRVADVPALGAELGLPLQLPHWLPPHDPVGVVCLELRPNAGLGLKLYLGSADPLTLAASAPRSVSVLARAMRAACPAANTYHYLTIRLGPGRPRYAINKIYNSVQLLDDAPERRRAWQDVASLFELASASAQLAQLLQSLRQQGPLPLIFAPTATALEGRMNRADVYFTAIARRRGTLSGSFNGGSLAGHDSRVQG